MSRVDTCLRVPITVPAASYDAGPFSIGHFSGHLGRAGGVRRLAGHYSRYHAFVRGCRHSLAAWLTENRGVDSSILSLATTSAPHSQPLPPRRLSDSDAAGHTDNRGPEGANDGGSCLWVRGDCSRSSTTIETSAF